MDSAPRKLGIDYETILREQYHGVVRRVLGAVAKDGLPAGHHFYLGFKTDYPGVEVPQSLRERYPDNITVVLEHQFWGLAVDEKKIEVTLAFNGVHHRVTIPFNALLAFADPFAQFQFQMRPGPVAAEPAPDAPKADAKPVAIARPDLGTNVVTVPFGRR